LLCLTLSGQSSKQKKEEKTMALFDKLTQVAKNLGDMAGDTIETTKLNARAAKENAQALEQITKIGDFYYKQFLNGIEVAPEVAEYCQTAKSFYDAAAATQAEIERIKTASAQPSYGANSPNGATCPGCGAPAPAGTKFCNNCGSRIETPVAQNSFCPGCGTQLSPGTKFCNNCGTPV